ncbi:hypothetical protein CTI12_AA429730 [Artemisia annua]|uniref:Uncharacterized protein n=1 Tax=Artemisia annua TaxID=35608 RepID=A0A2U1M1P6_ARTAN|nr:hypothetical protein CTI12_AA429730 [Artemisia annua]
MAAKSDFAQKLLLDLRLRKERMGVNQSSAGNATTRDAYRSPGNVQRGSRQSLELIGGSKTMNQQLVPSRGSNRASNIKESSQQLVSYTGSQHRRSDTIGDLSMAFTYAIKNGINIGDILNKISQRSLDVGNARNGAMTTSLVKHRPSNDGTLTTIQIKEISKGVRNLYEIIRSSSNGANVDRYSMEVGQELLKGAKGLEESLKMLVNLQEASELMVSPKRKSRVTLLEVDDDNEDDRSKVIDKNQVALPRFSFDKPSKKLSGHRRSASCDVESVRSVSTTNNNQTREKGRISNVIAKLMGLEEVPGKVDSYSKRDELKNAEDINTNMVYKASRPPKDSTVSLNDRKIQKPDDLNTNTIQKTSRAAKDSVVSLDDRKSYQNHDSNDNGMSRTKQRNNNQSDRHPEKQERQTTSETKVKMQQKRRNTEVALRVDKKKTIRAEKSNEIKLVPRNNQVKEAEKKIQKSKQDSQKIKEVKHTSSPSKEPPKEPKAQTPEQVPKARDRTPKEQEYKSQTLEQIPKAKDPTPKAQEYEKTERLVKPPVVKEKPVTRKKVDSMAVHKTEARRTRDEVLRKRNQTVNTLPTQLKHKLSVLKETKTKDVSINNKRLNSREPEPTIKLDVTVPVYENEIKSDPRITSEIIVANGSKERTKEMGDVSKNKPKKASNFSIQVVLTEDEKQLKEILIKDQLFLSTAQALFQLNIPYSFLHVDDHNHHRDETKLKLDCGYEILKRKARNQELSLHPYVKPSIGFMAISFLDELVKQLYKDLENLRLYGSNARNEYDEADYLHHMLEKDIYNAYPDISSFWDFGWHTSTFAFAEKDEFVNVVEQDLLHRLVDEIVVDLLSMSLPF